MSSFKIGVLSDSHTKEELQKEAIKKLISEGANCLLHLGDFVLPSNLIALKEAGLPYASVYGNNDHQLIDMQNQYKIYKEPYYLKIKDTTIKMMHLPYYLSPDSNIVLFGHTHQFSVEFKNSTLFLNPGEVCAREKNLTECALIEVFKDRYLVKQLFKEPQASKWQSKIYKFKG